MAPMPYSRETLARLRVRGNDGTFLDSLEKAVHAANVPEILRLPTGRKMQPAKCRPTRQRSEKKTDSTDDTATSQVVVTVPASTEWQYRGRTGAEVNAPQPIQAPTEMKNQKDEGFQRFFKQVSSPGHVRVTAGGRIVPNTRAPPSPHGKREAAAAQSLHLNGQNAAATTSGLRSCKGRPETSHPAPPPPTMAAMPAVPSFPPPYPGYPGGILPPQLPFWAYHPALAYPGLVPPPMSRPVGGDAATKRSASGYSQAPDTNGGVRVSPPKQFDPGRPFMVNGQWVMPLSNHPYSPYVAPPPPIMAHHPSLYAPPPHAAQVAAPAAAPPSSAPPTTGPLQGLAPSNTSLHGPSTTQNHGNQQGPSAPADAPSNPPISSIRPSQITKSHIESLRQNLKRVEDQLQYNTHQIDVKHMQSLAKEIRDSINVLEQSYPRQLEFESMNYPKVEGEEQKPNGELFNHPVTAVARGLYQNGVPLARKKSSVRGPLGSTKHGKTPFSVETDFQGSASSDSETPRNFSGIPVSAVAAPPFQPSAQLSSNSDDSTKGPKPVDTAAMMSQFRMNTHVPAGEKGDKAADGAGSQAFERNGHANGQTLTSVGTVTSGPYLVGVLPRGVDEATALKTGYLYQRELTSDERRAQFLYWVSAPAEVTTGLPMFDGKDFYHAMPTKQRDGGRSMTTTGGFDASRTTTDPFSSGESRNAETHTRATSYSVSDDLIDVKKGETNEGMNHTGTVRIRRPDDRASGRENAVFKQFLGKTGASINKTAVPGEVSSTTVQGYVPHYTAGNAAASLTPAIASAHQATGSSPPHSTSKLSEGEDKTTPDSPLAAKRSENRPPVADFVVESVRNLRF